LTASPCTLVSPVVPRISSKPARRRSRVRILPARPIWSSSAENSPVAGGEPAWVSVMNRASVKALRFTGCLQDDGRIISALARQEQCGFHCPQNLLMYSSSRQRRSLKRHKGGGNRSNDHLCLHQYRNTGRVVREPYPDVALIQKEPAKRHDCQDTDGLNFTERAFHSLKTF